VNRYVPDTPTGRGKPRTFEDTVPETPRGWDNPITVTEPLTPMG